MRILHVFKTYLPDSFTGIERVIWEIAESTARFGFEHHVLTVSPNADPAPLQIGSHHVHRARQDAYIAATAISVSLFRHHRALARESDVLHYHFPWPMMDLAHLAPGPARPSLVTYHSDVVRQKTLGRLYQPLMHRFLDSMDRIVATSPNYVQSSPVLRRYPGKTEVIPIGIAQQKSVPSDAERMRWRETLGERFFLFVGALRYYKGLGFLFEAARKSGLPVVVAGSGKLGPEIGTPPPNVRLLGHVSDADKAAILSLCTGFVFPSHLRSEAFGVALLEAAMQGKPMISCELGTGTSYVNMDGTTGFVVPPANADALADAMRRLWDDKAMAARMGSAASERYERLFTAEHMAAEYARLYRELGQPRRTAPA